MTRAQRRSLMLVVAAWFMVVFAQIVVPYLDAAPGETPLAHAVGAFFCLVGAFGAVMYFLQLGGRRPPN
ncbi:hypothetical protein GURKE_04210 [Brevundimonas phage vB_BpoS-Gurke]|uniref:Uncharacterized protein n=1 Tax=Brevundimonas phage vB_BpoS-Gurke TaxID=2948599 RepID=A0A9E7N421_9CAUD|nr:hypothetical protein GURKE_04210 [Brevundimonas phage vB_BpoS-Gurke]